MTQRPAKPCTPVRFRAWPPNLCKASNFIFAFRPSSDISLCSVLIPCSSVVEQTAVNRSVAGSSPARGATTQNINPALSPAFAGFLLPRRAPQLSLTDVVAASAPHAQTKPSIQKPSIDGRIGEKKREQENSAAILARTWIKTLRFLKICHG